MIIETKKSVTITLENTSEISIFLDMLHLLWRSEDGNCITSDNHDLVIKLIKDLGGNETE